MAKYKVSPFVNSVWYFPATSTRVARAGHFRYFYIFSIIKNEFFAFFYQVNNLFLHRVLSKKPTPSQIILIQNAKNHFLLLKQHKNTSSAQLWSLFCIFQLQARGKPDEGQEDTVDLSLFFQLNSFFITKPPSFGLLQLIC